MHNKPCVPYAPLWALALAVLMATMTTGAYARPISYPGGTSLMQMNDWASSSLHLHYSPKHYYSVGYRAEYNHPIRWQFHGMQVNWLLKRVNLPSSQANFYAKTAMGYMQGRVAMPAPAMRRNITRIGGYGELAADWEDRRFFTSYAARIWQADGITTDISQTARIGIAPYIGEYGDIHTWVMLQWDGMHNQASPIQRDRRHTFTPMLRFFKGDSLLELGISHRKDVMAHFMYRF